MKKYLKKFFYGLPGLVISGLYHAVVVIAVAEGIHGLWSGILSGKIWTDAIGQLGRLLHSPSNFVEYVILPFLLSFIAISITVASYQYLVKYGELVIEGKRSGRLSFISLFSLINPIYHLRTLYYLHYFHHCYHRHISLIQDMPSSGGLRLDNALVHNAIDELLVKAKIVLDAVLHDDTAVHIKVFESEMVHELCDANRSQTKLRTYRRNPSNLEVFRRSKGLRRRNQVELFDTDPSQSLSDIPHLQVNYSRDKSKSENRRMNTAYNFVLQPNDHKYFICNDLKRAEAEGLYYSNSDDWEDYYASLAVFLIWQPHGDNFVGKDPRKPLGMLIIDSMSKGRFDRWRLKAVAGLLAHRFYDFFVAVNAQSTGTQQLIATPSPVVST